MTPLPERAHRDAVIVGGGPAGAAAARLLALWGRRVLLLESTRSGRPGLAESLPPSARKLLDVLRLTDAVEAAGFVRGRGNTIWWPGSDRRRIRFPDGPGWQVERPVFDDLLLGLAREAGAEVRRGAAVERVEAGDGRVRYRTPAGERAAAGRRSIRSRFVLDCSGRAGVLASDGLRLREGAPPTTALIGAWRRPGGWRLDDPSHTLVEGYEDGWAWSVPVSPEVRYVTAMVDPDETSVRRDAGLEGMYRAELEKTGRLAALLEGARPEAPPRACSATPYTARRFGGAGFLLVGDAASFIDPLSSYGLKKALASAWLAAVVVNTLLDEPKLEDEALAFYGRREREVFRSYAQRAASFYARGASVHEHPFWARRARAPGTVRAEAPDAGLTAAPWGDGAEAGGSAPGPADAGATGLGGPAGARVEALRGDPDVLSAFEALRSAERVRLELTRPAELVRSPAVRGRKLELEDRLVTPSFPDGVRYLRDVDLVGLVRTVVAAPPSEADVPGLYERYRRAVGPVILPDFLGALSVLASEGIVENRARERPRAGKVARR